MITINHGVIEIIRGDSNPDLPLKIVARTSPNVDITITKATFSLKRCIADTEYVMQKDVTNGYLSFTHEETNSLELGHYYYDIQIEFNNGNVASKVGNFVVKYDITRE